MAKTTIELDVPKTAADRIALQDANRECQCAKCGRLHRKLANNPPASISGEWKCSARSSIDPPQECDWPLCSCDPYANKVKASLQECGVLQDAGRA